MDHNNNTQPRQLKIENLITEREIPPHLHVMMFKPFRKSRLSKYFLKDNFFIFLSKGNKHNKYLASFDFL